MRTASVASLRLDAVLAAMLQVSRTAGCAVGAQRRMYPSTMYPCKVRMRVFENDIFSVRGHGKYKLCEVGGKSRKGKDDRVLFSILNGGNSMNSDEIRERSVRPNDARLPPGGSG